MAPPVWLLAGMSWLIEKIGNKAGVIAVALAINAAVLAGGMYILTSLIPMIAAPAIVMRALSIVAPSDWVAQVSVMLSIKAFVMSHRAMLQLYEAAK